MRTALVVSLAAAAALGAGGTAFAQIDRSGLSRADVQERASQTFARFDANGDGKLDSADREAHLEARRKAAFERIDRDGDGQISFAEFSGQDHLRRERPAGMGAGRGEPPRPSPAVGFGARPALRGADADGDGSVSEAEFTDAALARFDRVDVDKDGTITADERRPFRFGPRRAPARGGAS